MIDSIIILCKNLRYRLKDSLKHEWSNDILNPVASLMISHHIQHQRQGVYILDVQQDISAAGAIVIKWPNQVK